MVDTQYDVIVMGGREVSRPYRVWFFAEGERFYPFGDATDLAWEGGVGDVMWCGVADSSICLKSDMPLH